MQNLPIVAQLPAPSPTDVNQTGEVVMGLGLSAFMLVGFLVIVLLLVVIPMAVTWSKRRQLRHP